MIVSEAELIAAVTRDRAAGKRIGFVPASFDLLRVDLVRQLQASAARSGRLVVAVVDGGGTPLISVNDRAELINGLRGVDYVIIRATDQVEPLVALLAPDIT